MNDKMDLTKCCILILCFAGVLSNSINISNPVENETQPFIEIGGKHYLINTTSAMNWFGAMLYCHNYNSDLVVIESEAEMDALSSYLTTNEGHVRKHFWLGVTDLAEEGKFMSFKDGRPMSYAKWSQGNPDNTQEEDCVHLFASDNIFYMNDIDCMTKLYAICELRQPKKTCDVCDLKNFMQRFMQNRNVSNCQN